MGRLQELYDNMTEEERDQARRILNEEPPAYRGTEITFYFPPRQKLEPFSLVGDVPRKGDIVYIRNWSLRAEKNKDFRFNSRWKVKEVHWSVTTAGTLKEQLTMRPSQRAEVCLIQHTPWWAREPFWTIRKIFRQITEPLGISSYNE
jgi:hypothetical protein